MTNNDFIKELKRQGINSINDLPSGYDYNISKKSLILKLTKKGVCENMQSDESAFESWAIILKRYCGKLFDFVIIDWDDVDENNEHFNRFVYRLTKFVQSYDWVSPKKKLPAMPALLYCSAPNGNAAVKGKHPKGSEGWIECDFIEKNVGRYDAIDHQLPVGLFDGKVSAKTHYTPGRLSQIDIWAIKDEEMFIFELKKPKNCPLGIISELMFYTNVVCDMISHNIIIDKQKAIRASQNRYRSFDKFYEVYNGYKKISKIHAVFLADELHSLLDDNVLEIINSSIRFCQHNVVFEVSKP